MAAVSGDHKMVAQLLIEHGADIGALSKEGTTAEDIARKNANTQIIALFKGDAISQNAKSRPMKIVLRPTIGTVNDKALEKGSLRGWELRTAQGQFLDMLSETDLFASVDATDAEARADAGTIVAVLKLEEDEDRHIAANATKAFMVGFFTLGLAPGVTSDYTYASKATLVVERPDGVRHQYNASADTTSETFGNPTTRSYATESGDAKSTARRFVTQQVLESLISQLEADQDFFETQ